MRASMRRAGGSRYTCTMFAVRRRATRRSLGFALALGSLLIATSARAHPGASARKTQLDGRIRAAPKNPALYVMRAAELRRLGDFHDAHHDLERALALDPTEPLAHCERARVFADEAKLDRARVSWDECLRRSPAYADAWVERGELRRRLGELEGARADFARALALGPQLETFALAAEFERERGEWEAARALLERALEQLGPSYVVYARLVELDTAMGRPDRALDTLDLALHALGPTPGLIRWRGELLSALGDDTGARQHFEEALMRVREDEASRPTTARRLERARLLILLDRRAEAVALLHELVESEAVAADAWSLLTPLTGERPS